MTRQPDLFDKAEGEPPPFSANTIEEVEQAAPIEVAATFSDDELASAGFVPVRAFVRSKASANALRQQRKRDRQAERGEAQLNVTAPADEETRQALKAIAADLKRGAIRARELTALANVLRSGGWRAWIVRNVIRRG